MDIESIIIQYGYIFILIGTFFEGETVLVLAGFLVHQGYLSFTPVVAAAFIGTYVGDQLYFYIGRRKGIDLLDRNPSWKRQSGRVFPLLQHYQTMVIIGFRFIYGIRTVTPFILGASGVSPRRFMVLNAVGGIAWSLGIASLGYMLGYTAEVIIQDIKRYEYIIMASIVMAGIVFWGIYLIRRKRRGV
ncbi:MAG TPA: DedA family protein [Deltaproteobacteria bacterium]|nr:DedA family protein [Deltaproteobacteria bacterium]HOM28748.1 DedA family protein [Deltaproteobacteria bacterium]HPP81467.1 DedA family protein [Deltaproteobacteria bacterium]